LFPGRIEVPKTLIFAKDDHHAEEITYKTDCADPESLVRTFRND
jgi:type I restriction enzyme R subunit